MSTTAWAYLSSLGTVLIYLLIVYTPVGQTFAAGWLFGAHLLSAVAGVVLSIVTLPQRRLACFPVFAVCTYILLFQLTSLVPSPQMLLQAGRPSVQVPR